VSADRTLLEIHEALGELFSRHADLEARIERMFRKGKVTDVDATKGLYRQETIKVKQSSHRGLPIRRSPAPASRIRRRASVSNIC
jgi:hypothetical protein